MRSQEGTQTRTATLTLLQRRQTQAGRVACEFAADEFGSQQERVRRKGELLAATQQLVHRGENLPKQKTDGVRLVGWRASNAMIS